MRAWRRGPTARRQPTDALFDRFQRLIEQESGIQLGLMKKSLLVGRLASRLRQLGLDSLEQYYPLVADSAGTVERAEMIDRICTNETRFLREPAQFEFLAHQAIPEWKAQAATQTREKRLRVWSVACSTGEEPYSVAMVLRRHLPAEAGWSLDILGTDLSRRALARAQSATWPARQAAEIPTGYLRQFMRRGRGASTGWMRASDDLRRLVRIAPFNLVAPVYSVGGPFDLILCRNVLMYLAPDTRRDVIGRLVKLLEPRGYLLVGHAEGLARLSDAVTPVVPTIYRRRPDPKR